MSNHLTFVCKFIQLLLQKTSKNSICPICIPDSPPTASKGQPPHKRSRLLGDIDLNSPEVQKLLKANSSHTGAVNEVNVLFYHSLSHITIVMLVNYYIL